MKPSVRRLVPVHHQVVHRVALRATQLHLQRLRKGPTRQLAHRIGTRTNRSNLQLHSFFSLALDRASALAVSTGSTITPHHYPNEYRTPQVTFPRLPQSNKPDQRKRE